MKVVAWLAFAAFALFKLAPLLTQPHAWIAVLFVLALIAIGKPANG